jgi:hypothetical protein
MILDGVFLATKETDRQEDSETAKAKTENMG